MFFDSFALGTSGFPVMFPAMFFWLVVIAVWDLIWKGIALWHAARNGQNRWFIAILILNTMGLLPIIYLVWFRKEGGKESEKKKRKKGGK